MLELSSHLKLKTMMMFINRTGASARTWFVSGSSYAYNCTRAVLVRDFCMIGCLSRARALLAQVCIL